MKVVIVFILVPGNKVIFVGSGSLRSALMRVPDPTKIKYETLSNVIGAFKTIAATRINKLRGVIGVPVWQKSFHDRVVRNNHELEYIQKYIQYNPVKWTEDRDNPSSSKYAASVKSIDDYWNEIFEV